LGKCRRIVNRRFELIMSAACSALNRYSARASGALGNKISLDDEVSKLRLVVETAREVWGA
jgi:hypothetical protein